MARPTLPNFALASTFQGFEWFHYRFGRIVITSVGVEKVTLISS